MKWLLLVGAGGLAREVLAVERRLRRFAGVLLIDDDSSLWGTDLDGEPIVGGLALAEAYEDHDILVCAGNGRTRRSIVQRLGAHGVDPARYRTFVDPSVVIPEDCRVGAGSILLAGTVLTTSVQVGRHVVVMPNVTLTHDDVVEDFATICAGVSLGGGVRVGEAAYLGMNASVRQGLHVGPDATLGMGAAVIDDVPPGDTWVGVPAHSIERSARQAS